MCVTITCIKLVHPRNRGIHGDMVAVQLLPKELWRTRSGQLAESADSNSTVMTTGVVVGIISRKDREYVASFDVSIRTM